MTCAVVCEHAYIHDIVVLHHWSSVVCFPHSVVRGVNVHQWLISLVPMYFNVAC